MDFSKRSVQFHPCCPLCIGSSRQEIGTRYSNRSSPNISNNVSNGSHENTVSLYLFQGLVTGRNHVDDHTSLTWSSTVSHVLQDPQHLCIGKVCTYLCMYARFSLAKMARGQHAGLVASRGVCLLSGRRPVGPTYEVDR